MTLRTPTRHAVSIPKFISHGASALTAAEIEHFPRHAPRLRAKLRRLHKAGYHTLHDEAAALLDYALAACQGRCPAFKPRAMFDAIFALLYLLKGVDAIPDSVPDIGYEDDRIIIHHVWKTHRDVLTHPAAA